jgi:hypothetical protein
MPRRAVGPVSLPAGAILAVGLLLVTTRSLEAHPPPDVPVRAFFAADGSAVVKIEIDPRCFTDDPATAPYLVKDEYQRLSASARDRLLGKARRYVRGVVELSFEPPGVAKPEWTFEFTTFRDSELTNPDDPVMLTGTWRPDLAGRTEYRLRSLPRGKLSVLFLNYYQGQVLKGVQVLFPGEESEALDLTTLADAELGGVYEQLIGSVAPGP